MSAYSQWRRYPTVHTDSPDTFEPQPPCSEGEARRARSVPGTSSVSLSFKTPKLHFSGFDLVSWYSSPIEVAELTGSCVVAEFAPKNRLHPELLALALLLPSVAETGC